MGNNYSIVALFILLLYYYFFILSRLLGGVFINTVEIIKNIINESLEITSLSDIEIATIETIQPLSIKLANDKILPKEFLLYKPKMMYLKNTNNELELNSKVLIQKRLGGQQYLIIDTLEDTTIGNTVSTVTDIAPLKIKLANNKILERKDLMIFSKGIEIENGKKLITIRETGTGKYMFIAESE